MVLGAVRSGAICRPTTACCDKSQENTPSYNLLNIKYRDLGPRYV